MTGRSATRSGRVAVVVPPANPTVEPEFTELLTPHVPFHTTRFPVFAGRDQRQRNQGYLDSEAAAVRSFGTLALDGLFIACTGSHYLLSPAADARRCDELSDAAGFPVRSATLAITDTLEAVGASDIHIVSPYEGWLTDLSHRYWEAAGFRVSSVVEVRATTGSPYDVAPEEMVRQVAAADLPRDGVILFTGTGMPTLRAIAALGDGTGRTVLSSNLCGAHWLLSRTGPASTAACHPALRRLRRQVGEVTAS